MSTPVGPSHRDEQNMERYTPSATTSGAVTPVTDRFDAEPETGVYPTADMTQETPPQVVHEQTEYLDPTPAAPSRSFGQVAADLGVDRETVVAREKEQFGGMKFGAGFFGWVAAAGIAVILTSLLTAAGVALTLGSKTTTTEITNQAAAGTGTAKTIGLVGAILLLVVLFVAYYCGGYVAARMARFNGIKQGLAVWLWGIVFAIVIFILVKVAGSKYNILNNLNLPRIPVDEGSLTTAAIIAVAAVIVVTLGSALLGGLAGMHFHRKVDKAGLTV